MDDQKSDNIIGDQMRKMENDLFAFDRFVEFVKRKDRYREYKFRIDVQLDESRSDFMFGDVLTLDREFLENWVIPGLVERREKYKKIIDYAKESI